MTSDDLKGRMLAIELCMVSLIMNIPDDQKGGLFRHYQKLSEAMMGNLIASQSSEEMLQSFEQATSQISSAYKTQRGYK